MIYDNTDMEVETMLEKTTSSGVAPSAAWIPSRGKVACSCSYSTLCSCLSGWSYWWCWWRWCPLMWRRCSDRWWCRKYNGDHHSSWWISDGDHHDSWVVSSWPQFGLEGQQFFTVPHLQSVSEKPYTANGAASLQSDSNLTLLSSISNSSPSKPGYLL